MELCLISLVHLTISHSCVFPLLLYLYPIHVRVSVKQVKMEIYQFLTAKQVSWYQIVTVVSGCHGMSFESEVKFLIPPHASSYPHINSVEET